MSCTPGRIFIETPAISDARSARSTSSGAGEGMASSTCWMVKRLAASGMSSIVPTTGTPRRERPCALESSSNTATGTRPAPGLRSISRMAAAPVSRLPITATRSPTRLEPRCQANSREWNRRTPMPAAENVQPTTTTMGGTSSTRRVRPTGQNAISTHSVTAADSMSWRASSAPAWRQMRP